MACRIRRDDTVVVIAGVNKGERGKVLRVIPKQGLVVVEGVNMVHRHVRPSRRNPQGGRLRKEAPFDICKVLPLDPKTNRPARVRFELEKDASGKVIAKRRVTVNGTVLGQVSRSSQES